MPDGLADALRKFNPATLEIIEEAEQLARRNGHGFLGVEHLLAALLPLAQRRLQPEIFRTLERILTPLLQTHYAATPAGDQTHVTYRVEALLTTHALATACQRGHDLVEPEDLLIAIVREGRSLPVLQLQAQGIDVGELLSQLEQIAPPPLEIPDFLRTWCDDLTARVDQLPPFIEGERERKIIDQVVRVLVSDLRLSPASPVLIGEAGVGKTAIVQLLARKIVRGDIPRLPRDVRIVQVNMNTMVAGTIWRGMFEANLDRTIRFAKQYRDRVILFIDELHMIVGAGQGADQILLEPLGRGEIRLIGATTSEQYRQYIEARDSALARRFRAIPVPEPSLGETRQMLNQLCPKLEQYSGVQISSEAREKALELSRFYLRARHLPDKPISWLKEAISLAVHQQRQTVLADDVVTIVSEQTGIPPDIIFRNAHGRLSHMEQVLRKRVIGQDHVIAQVARRIRLNLGPLRENLNRPLGVFLFLGPSGVGKTELAKALAEFLFGDEGRMIRLDMSEYTSGVTTHQLIGPPPGIVGCDRGGRLTNAIRAQPYTIVLLDEFEKAHPDIRNLFLQVFDEGWLTDGLGRKVYFTDAILIATSNLASEKYRLLQSRPGFRSMRGEDLDFQEVRKEVERSLVEEGLLPPELKNRFDLICIFDPLSEEVLRQIAQKFLDDLAEELQRWGKTLLYDNGVTQFLARQGYDPLLGARELKRLFTQSVREQVAEVLDQGSVFRVEVEVACSELKVRVVQRDLELEGEPFADPSGNS
jgi:ATP-dependent Clp protease ATP-binding subunit ClpC